MCRQRAARYVYGWWLCNNVSGSRDWWCACVRVRAPTQVRVFAVTPSARTRAHSVHLPAAITATIIVIIIVVLTGYEARAFHGIPHTRM